MSAALRIGLAFVASLALAAPARAASVTFEGVVVAGEGYRVDALARMKDAPASAPPCITATLTISREGMGTVATRTNAMGRFRLSVPREWLDDQCVLTIDGDDNGGLELPCVPALGPDVTNPEPVLVTLPAGPRAVLLAEDAEASEEAKRIRSTVAERLAEFRAFDNQGKEWTRAALAGHWTLLSFTSPTCGPCRGENKRLKEGRRELERAGVDVLHVRARAPEQPIEADAAFDKTLAWPRIVMTWDEFNLWGLKHVPMNVLVGPDGAPAAVDIHGPEMIATIARLANDGKPVRAPLAR